MRNHHTVLSLVLSWFCIFQVQTIFAQNSQVTVNGIIKENIISMIGLPSYSTELQSGDEFVYISSFGLGLALDPDALDFSKMSFNEVTTNNIALANGYKFARLVNNILIFRGESFTQGNILENYGDQSKLLSSPLYGNSFGLIGIVPSPNSISWEKFNKVQKGEVQYLLKFDLGRLNLERGWLDIDSLRDKNLPKGSSVIVGLVLTKSLSLDLYREKYLSDRLKSNDITIVGYICVVI